MGLPTPREERGGRFRFIDSRPEQQPTSRQDVHLMREFLRQGNFFFRAYWGGTGLGLHVTVIIFGCSFNSATPCGNLSPNVGWSLRPLGDNKKWTIATKGLE